jgi:hypothetical protein
MLVHFNFSVYRESGVHLNKDYNSKVYLKNAVKMIMLFTYTCRMRACWAHFREQVIKVRTAIRNRSARTISRSIRRYNRWKHYLATEHAKEQQALAEAKRARDRFLLEHKSATILKLCLFRNTKMRVIRRRLLQKRSIALLQRFYRGYRGRLRYRRINERRKYRSSYALKIQMCYRRHLARRKLILKRKLKFVHDWLAHINNERLQTIRQYKMDGAECYIAHAYRLYQMRKRLKKIMYWNRFAKAIVIQKNFRGYIVRKIVGKEIRAFRIRLKNREEAARKIQRLARFYNARMKFDRIFEAKELEWERKMQLKHHKLQSGKRIRLMRMIKNALPFQYLRRKYDY